jgi:hypothetical protein
MMVILAWRTAITRTPDSDLGPGQRDGRHDLLAGLVSNGI